MKRRYILLTFLLVLLFYLFFTYILYPAHLSVLSACNSNNFGVNYPNYYVAGSETINETNKTNPKITVYLKDKNNIPIKMHERIHIWQYKKGILFDCSNPSLKLGDEIMAYSVQRYYELLE